MTTPNDQRDRPPAEPEERSGGPRRLLQVLLTNTSEFIQTIALALGLFLVFMSILLLSFPKGSGLPSLYKEWIGASKKSSSLVLSGDEQVSGHVAVLTGVSRTVKDRPSDAVAWKNAESGMLIENRHAIQTLSRSKAGITFPDDSTLELAQNSLVVVTRASQRRSARTTRASLVVLSGQIQGNLAPAHLADVPLELKVGGAIAHVRAEGDIPAEYSLQHNAVDNSATLSIYAGTAEVTAEGETRQLERSQSLTIVPDQPLGPTMRIPDPPRRLSPSDGTTLAWSVSAPKVRFEWSSSTGVAAYRFVVARDRSFSDVIYDVVVEQPNSEFGNLHSGWYYWRVHAQNGPVISLPSRIQRLLIVHDSDPPALRVEMADDVYDLAEIVIRGVTDPGTEVSIGDHQVDVSSSGDFEHVLDLIRGPNLVVIEAIDAAGNVSYHSQYVNARF